MVFKLSSTSLANQLMILSRVINSKNSMPILGCFLFNVADGILTITASDSENVMLTRIHLDECDGEGTFAVKNNTIIDAVKELPDQPLAVNVNMDESTIYISYQNGNISFPIDNAEEYPQMQPMGDDTKEISINSALLAANIGRSLFATAQDELRPVMNGIYFDLTPESLTIVASDGHKLVRNRNFDIKSEEPSAFIMPKKPATLLKNVLTRDDSMVTLAFDSRQARISFDESELYCRLIEGRYPNYNSVIPSDNPNRITIDRKSLMGALRRVLPFASDASELIRLHVEMGKVELSAEDIDFATNAKEDIACEYDGNAMSIGFKGSSLLETLNNIESDDVVILLADPSRPGVVVPAAQPENEEVLMIIMPMLLND